MASNPKPAPAPASSNPGDGLAYFGEGVPAPSVPFNLSKAREIDWELMSWSDTPYDPDRYPPVEGEGGEACGIMEASLRTAVDPEFKLEEGPWENREQALVVPADEAKGQDPHALPDCAGKAVAPLQEARSGDPQALLQYGFGGEGAGFGLPDLLLPAVDPGCIGGRCVPAALGSRWQRAFPGRPGQFHLDGKGAVGLAARRMGLPKRHEVAVRLEGRGVGLPADAAVQGTAVELVGAGEGLLIFTHLRHVGEAQGPPWLIGGHQVQGQPDDVNVRAGAARRHGTER